MEGQSVIKGGYVLQPRRFDNSDAARMPPVARELWFYILRNVSYQTTEKYTRGQGFFNLSDIQDALCWYSGYRKNTYSKPQLTKSLRRLCEGNMVETTKATRGVVITVCNYDLYQDPTNYEGNDEGNTKETRRKREGHTKYKKVKEVKEGKKEHIEIPSWIPSEEWDAFVEMRKVIKSTLTDHAKTLAIGKLEKLKEKGHDPADVLNQSVMNNWKGLFELKGGRDELMKRNNDVEFDYLKELGLTDEMVGEKS